MLDHRWSDERLEQFYGEFREHKLNEALEQKQNQEIYDAVFQRADPDTNTPPGLLQATAQISKQLHDIAVRQDRQKIAVRTAIATCSAVWFVLTGAGQKFLMLLQRL